MHFQIDPGTGHLADQHGRSKSEPGNAKRSVPADPGAPQAQAYSDQEGKRTHNTGLAQHLEDDVVRFPRRQICPWHACRQLVVVVYRTPAQNGPLQNHVA